MDSTEEKRGFDPGDWYSALFIEDPDKNNQGYTAADGATEDGSKEESGQTSGLQESHSHGEGWDGASDRASMEIVSESVMERGPIKRRGNGRNIPAVLFFSFSLIVFIACLFALFHFNGIELSQQIIPTHEGEYVSSYLTYAARRSMAQSVLHLLRQNRAGLESVLQEMKQLDDDKTAFLKDMEQRERLYTQNRSIFQLTGTEKKLQSIAELVKSDVEFRGEKRRRIRLYLELYNRKRQSLLAQKAGYEKTIAGLTAYQNELYRIDASGIPDIQESFALDTIRAADIEKILYFIENEDYRQAEVALRRLEPLLSGKTAVTVQLLSRLSALLHEYNRRIALLTRSSPFEEISRAYLNEQYDEVEKNIEAIEKEGFLKPLLSGIDGSLFTNKAVRDTYEAKIDQNKKLSALVRKAESFEKQKEYRSAIDIYQDLLAFRLGSYDREMVLTRLRTAWFAYEKQKIRRDENTQAIKYMDSARILSREGKDADALRYYSLLLQNCPNSDYTREALESIVRLTSLQKTPE